MRLVTAAAVTVALLVVPSAASAESVTQTAGTTTATLSWTPPPPDGGIGVSDLQLTITRDAAVVFSGDPGVRGCTGADASCAVQAFGDGPLTVRDLDGDAEAEVVVWLFTGGAHCCSVVRALSYDRDTNTYAGPSVDFRDAGAELRDFDRDGRPEFASADARFAFAFSSFASSGFPLQVKRLRDGRFVDVTRRYPARIRRDARRWLRTYRANVRAKTEPLGALAAFVADRYLLGRGRSAQAFLRSERRKGHLRGGGPGDVKGGAAYIRGLNRLLRRLGYR